MKFVFVKERYNKITKGTVFLMKHGVYAVEFALLQFRLYTVILAVDVGVMYEKVAINSRQPAVSLKRVQFDSELLLTAYIKSYTSYRLLPN